MYLNLCQIRKFGSKTAVTTRNPSCF